MKIILEQLQCDYCASKEVSYKCSGCARYYCAQCGPQHKEQIEEVIEKYQLEGTMPF